MLRCKSAVGDRFAFNKSLKIRHFIKVACCDSPAGLTRIPQPTGGDHRLGPQSSRRLPELATSAAASTLARQGQAK